MKKFKALNKNRNWGIVICLILFFHISLLSQSKDSLYIEKLNFYIYKKNNEIISSKKLKIFKSKWIKLSYQEKLDLTLYFQKNENFFIGLNESEIFKIFGPSKDGTYIIEKDDSAKAILCSALVFIYNKKTVRGIFH